MKEIKTKLKSFRTATIDLTEKINKAIEDMGDKATYSISDDHGEIYLDFAFDSALGFTDGTGIYGHEGFGDCGPCIAEDISILCEPINSVTVGIYNE